MPLVTPDSYPPRHLHSPTGLAFGLCSHSGSRTAGLCSRGSRCSPCTWLDLELSSDGQASLTRVDGWAAAKKEEAQLPTTAHLCKQNSCHLPRLGEQGRLRQLCVPRPAPLCQCCWAQHPEQDTQKAIGATATCPAPHQQLSMPILL